MSYLKSFSVLLLFSIIFANCSTAQEKTNKELTNKATELPDKVNPETKKFESKAGNFSVNISQEPFQTRVLDAEKGEEPGKQFIWKFEKTIYTIMYSEFDKNDLSTAFDDMNSGVRKAMGRQGVEITSEKEIFYKKHRGLEFHYTIQNGVKYTLRNYLIDNAGYQVVAGYVDEQSEKEALEVLNSFKLLNEKN